MGTVVLALASFFGLVFDLAIVFDVRRRELIVEKNRSCRPAKIATENGCGSRAFPYKLIRRLVLPAIGQSVATLLGRAETLYRAQLRQSRLGGFRMGRRQELLGSFPNRDTNS
jgi:hypothetical protein